MAKKETLALMMFNLTNECLPCPSPQTSRFVSCLQAHQYISHPPPSLVHYTVRLLTRLWDRRQLPARLPPCQALRRVRDQCATEGLGVDLVTRLKNLVSGGTQDKRILWMKRCLLLKVSLECKQINQKVVTLRETANRYLLEQ